MSKTDKLTHLTPWQFFKLTFSDPNGMPDNNRLTMFASFGILVCYAPLSLFKTRLGLDYMPNELLGAFVSIVLASIGFTSRETVNKINVDKPEPAQPAVPAISVTGTGDITSQTP